MTDQFTIKHDYAVDTALPQDWLDAATERLPYNYDPRGEIGWGYPPGFTFGGVPVPLTQRGVLILGLLARYRSTMDIILSNSTEIALTFQEMYGHVKEITGGDRTQHLFKFENGFGASVVQSQYSYGGSSGLWEMALLKWKDLDSFDLVYDGDEFSDVRGWLGPAEIKELLDWAIALPSDYRVSTSMFDSWDDEDDSEPLLEPPQ